MAENEEEPGARVATRDEENCDREDHRYNVARILLLGLLIIMVIPVINKHYDNAVELAAIFGGWIGSVVGFYFLQQNTDKAQQQTTIAVKDAAEARKDVAGAAKTSVNLRDAWEVTSFKWRKRAENYLGLYDESEKSKTIYKDLYEEAQTLIDEMLQELDGDTGGDD